MSTGNRSQFGLKSLLIWMTAMAISFGVAYVGWHGDNLLAFFLAAPALIATIAAPAGQLVNGRQGLLIAVLAGVIVGIMLDVGFVIFTVWVFSQMP